jgi:peptide methionine sulfoxide reductase MsrA
LVTINLTTFEKDTVIDIQYDTLIDTLYKNNKLYFDITSPTTAEVTYKSSGENYISGDVVIPSEVVIKGNTYTVTGIGTKAFMNCSGITSVEIPSTITEISYMAFANCSSLTDVITSSITNINANAFENCSNLTSIILPSTLTEIGNYAFKDCRNLTDITIPSSVTSLATNIFNGCDNLTDISVETGNAVYDSRNNCNAIVETSTNTLVMGCKTTVIPSTITKIGEYAFEDCINLGKSITIPSSVTEMGEHVFMGCNNLDTMICEGTTPPTLTNKSSLKGNVLLVPCSAIDAYKNNTYFSSYFGNNIFSIDTLSITLNDTICENSTYTFGGEILSSAGTYISNEPNTNGCYTTTTLNLVVNPTYDNTINQSIFVGDTFYYNNNALTTTGAYTYPYTTINGCDSLVTINLTTFEKDTVIDIQYDTLIDTLYKNNKLYYNIISPTTAEVTYKSNGENYISGDVVIPSEVVIKGNTYTVTGISSKAFMNCSGLTSVEIPSSVTEIGYRAFANCSSLTDIIIPSSVTTINDYAFRNCSSLTSVTIPSSVTSLGTSPFMSCKSITDITVESSNTVYDSRDNCNAIIEKSTNTLISGCMNTIIPSTVTKIGENAFCDNTNLGKSITIPSSVTEIGKDAFIGCSKLDTMICEGTTVPTLTNIFSLVGKVLLVPCSAIDAYKNDTYLSQMFGSNIFSIDTLSITLNDTICENSTYTFGGEILSNAGTYISNEPNTNGCYTTTTLNLVVNPTYENTINQSIFEGDTFYYNTTALTTTGTYSYPYTTVNGCDSLVIVNLNTFSRDTITKIQIDTVRDTLINDLHDTTIVIDTFITIDTINTRDTLTLTNFIHDTTIVVDTFIINTYDTTTLIDTFIVDNYDTIIIHDTIIKTIIDTITNTVIDTITEVVHDTITPCAKVYTYIFATVVRGETYTDFGFNISEEGTYIDTLTTAEGCDSIIVLSLSLAEVIDNDQPAQIKLFPNPTSDKVYLDLINLPNADIIITNIKGEVSKQYDIPQDINEVVLDISDLPTGVYSVVISNDKTKLSKKIIKK